MDPYNMPETSSIQPEMPLALSMLDNPIMNNLPGPIGSMGFTNFRGTNTLMRGGFLEREGRISKRFAGRRLSKFKMIDPETGFFNQTAPSHFMGSTRRFPRKRGIRLAETGEKGGFLKSARVNNMTMRPRAFGSYHSASVFTDRGYSPFGLSRMIGNSSRAKAFAEKRNISVIEGQNLIGPGFVSFVGAGVKSDALERKALRQMEKTGKVSERTAKKLGRVDKNIRALTMENSPELMNSRLSYTVGEPRVTLKQSLGMSPLERGGLGAQEFSNTTRPISVTGRSSIIDEGLGRGISAETVGTRGNLLASSMAGPVTRYAAGYVRGAGGHGLLRMAGESEEAFIERGIAKNLLKETLMGSEQAIKTFGVALEKKGIMFGGKAGAEAAELALKGSVFKNLGKEGVIKALGTKAGAKVLGIRAASLAIPGLNLVSAAMMAYDLGKMAGDVVKGGINLAKDSITSMKGSISKPLFGMGYKDTEAAATSRSRGVMAIQNSQLNARSILGSEAGMLAAHFG